MTESDPPLRSVKMLFFVDSFLSSLPRRHPDILHLRHLAQEFVTFTYAFTVPHRSAILFNSSAYLSQSCRVAGSKSAPLGQTRV